MLLRRVEPPEAHQPCLLSFDAAVKSCIVDAAVKGHSLVAILLAQYMCVGLSVYDEAQLRAAGDESRSSPLAPVDIPYCEGLEIISAANVQESPALLAADAGAGQSPFSSGSFPLPSRSGVLCRLC